MKKTVKRIPEGDAIKDNASMTMEQYSKTMKKQLWQEYLRFADNVIKKVSPAQNSRVLEIGPGPGWAGISLLLKRDDMILEAIEPSSDMIRVASNNAIREGVSDRIKYKEGIAEEMKDIPDHHYDLLISRDSLHHWTDPEKVFRQITRILKDNGKVYIHDHRRDISLHGKIIVNVIGVLFAGKMAKYWKSSIAAAYTKEEIEIILQKAGCQNWKVETNLLDLTILED